MQYNLFFRQTSNVRPMKSVAHLNNIHTVHILHQRKHTASPLKNQSASIAQAHHERFCELYETHKYIVWAKYFFLLLKQVGQIV
jgi:hypothetical protein